MRFATLLRVIPAAAVLAGTLLLQPSQGFAHEGEDHAHAPQPAAITATTAPRAEAVSDQFELVAVARSGALTIYLDTFRTNEPVEGASISVETPAGAALASPVDGAYRLNAPWSAAPGRYDLIFTVTPKDGAADVLIATLVVPGTPPAGPDRAVSSLFSSTAFAGEFRNRVANGDPLLIATAVGGFVFGLLVMAIIGRRKAIPAFAVLAALSALPSRPGLAHEGEDHGSAPPMTAAGDRDLSQRLADGALFVPKPTQRILAIRTDVATAATHRRMIELPGRIIPDPNASGYVQASAGGRLSAPEGGFPRLGTRVKEGEVVAFVVRPLQAIDASDIRQRQGELDQQISIVERRIARFEALVQKGAATQVQLDETRLELQGLKDRRSALDRIRQEPEALVAPASGVVAEVNAVAGQMAQPGTVLFHIVDPARLWVEALSFDALVNAQSATARSTAGRALTLTYQGSGFADRNQAIPVHFRIEGDTHGLRVGQFVTVLAATEEEKSGIAVPRSSVVRSQAGQDLVFEHTGAERFEPRSVRVEPLDGERVLVVSGFGQGQRIVTQGAELLEQVR
ncbi:MAG: efflux RND transporter periplasmic adaptor subunit [Xanthobacteraceae bacterium]